MIDRRAMLRLMGGAAIGAGVPGIPTFGATGLDLTDRRDYLTAVTKLRGSTDDRLVMGWVIGTRYAVVNHRATPMLGILAGTFSRYRMISDEAYEARAIEVAYFTDVETGILAKTWKNPFTGKTVEVPQVRMGPSTIIMTADGLRIDSPAGEAAGMKIEHEFMPAVTRGDDVWITEEIRVDGRPPGADAKPFIYNEMTTYHGRKSDLDNPDLATVPTNVQFSGLVTWRPWMGFGDMPGHTVARGSGTRAQRVEDLPAYYLELTEQYHPDVLEDPLAVLSGSES